MGFFTGSSPCYCCGNKYWIRKYDPTPTLPVLAQVDVVPYVSQDVFGTQYGRQIIARGGKVTALWQSGATDRFARHDADLQHERNIEVTHTSLQLPWRWWDTNGSDLVVAVDGSVRFYASSGSLVFTFTPAGTEQLTKLAVDSAGNLYSTTVTQTTFPPITNRFIYKHNSTGVLQWKNATNSNAEGFLFVAADDFVWIYRPWIKLLERRSSGGAITSATVDLGVDGPQKFLFAHTDGSSGIWATDTDYATGQVRTKHVTSGFVIDRGLWNPGAAAASAVPNVPNILTFDGTTAAYARIVDVYPSTGAIESMQKLDSYGTTQWSRRRTDTPSYWGSQGGVASLAYANGALYAAGTRTP